MSETVEGDVLIGNTSISHPFFQWALRPTTFEAFEYLAYTTLTK
jgi:hypothetical protein